jgi:hypothetical protein
MSQMVPRHSMKRSGPLGRRLAEVLDSILALKPSLRVARPSKRGADRDGFCGGPGCSNGRTFVVIAKTEIIW